MKGEGRMVLVGLACGFGTDRSIAMNRDYPDAVERAGGAPVLIPPMADKAVLDRILSSLDGLVLTGGGDVDPSRYGARRIPECGPSDSIRDESDLYLCREALNRDLPLLGICRGFQVMNAALGGTLYQDIGTQYGHAIEHQRHDAPAGQVHTVTVAPGTRLAQILKKPSLGVNSRHHQALERPGEGLIISAAAPDGIAEGIEMPQNTFAVGVQWHPESLLAAGVEGAEELFSALIAACRARRGEEQ